MAQKKSITREQVLNALAKHNGLTTYNNQAGSHPRTPEEDRQLETLLSNTPITSICLVKSLVFLF